jgi:hypothetical protein
VLRSGLVVVVVVAAGVSALDSIGVTTVRPPGCRGSAVGGCVLGGGPVDGARARASFRACGGARLWRPL